MTDGLRIHLPQLFSLDPLRTDALDRFVSTCLASGGVWDHPRQSDGISNIDRVFERGPEGIGVCARIYEIDDQSLHTFWLEIRRDVKGITWSLHFDVVETSARRAYNAVHDHDRADDIEWRVRLTGDANIVDGVLVVVDESTSALVPAESAMSGDDEDAAQLEGDRKTVEALIAHGDPLTKSRAVDHWVYFASVSARVRFVSETDALGFSATEMHDDGKGPNPFWVCVSRVDHVDLVSIHRVVMTLVAAARRHGGDYDGWECPVEAAGPHSAT